MREGSNDPTYLYFPQKGVNLQQPAAVYTFSLPPFIIEEPAHRCKIGGLCGTQVGSPEANRLWNESSSAIFSTVSGRTFQRVSLKVGNAKKLIMPVRV